MDGSRPYKIATKLEKRRPGEAEPYEVDERVSYHEADGTEVHDHDRQRAIEAVLTATSEQES